MTARRCSASPAMLRVDGQSARRRHDHPDQHMLDSALSVLGNVPWDPVDAPIASLAAPRRAGLADPLYRRLAAAVSQRRRCLHLRRRLPRLPRRSLDRALGRRRLSANAIRLTRRFFTVPVEMQRELTVEGDLLIVRERLRMDGAQPIEVMWGHHPTFGSDLLAGAVRDHLRAPRVTVDDGYDPPPIRSARRGRRLADGRGQDRALRPRRRRPVRLAAMAYLHDFDGPGLRSAAWTTPSQSRCPGTRTVFPCAWLWYELGGTAEAPWHGRGE